MEVGRPTGLAQSRRRFRRAVLIFAVHVERHYEQQPRRAKIWLFGENPPAGGDRPRRIIAENLRQAEPQLEID